MGYIINYAISVEFRDLSSKYKWIININIARESRDKSVSNINKVKGGRRLLSMIDLANFSTYHQRYLQYFYDDRELILLLFWLDMMSLIRLEIADNMSVRSMRLANTP